LFTAGRNAEVRREDSVDDEVRGAIRVAGRPNHHGSGEFSVPLIQLCNGTEIGAQLRSLFADSAGRKRVRADGVRRWQRRQALCKLGSKDGGRDQHRCAMGDVQAG